MPLLRGIARTAAIAGTATAVSNRVSRRQENRWAAQEEPPPEPATPQQPPAADPMAQLQQLADLHDRGALTDEEFSAQKSKLLA
jgi:Short C-terminal domain